MNDVIYKQAAIEEIEKYFGDLAIQGRFDILSIIKNLPSAQPDIQECEKCIFQPFKQFQSERKKGKWLNDRGLYKCSNCNYIFSELWWVENCPIDRMNKIMRFCPQCGAEMETEK